MEDVRAAKISIFIWKCLRNSLPTDDNANDRGIVVDGGCVLCDDITVLEDQDHILMHCDFAKLVWNWLSTLLHLDLSFLGSVREMIKWATRRNLQDQYNQTLQLLIFQTLWILWKVRNKAVFEQRRDTIVQCIRRIKSAAAKSSFLLSGTVANSVSKTMFLRALAVKPRYEQQLTFSEVRWIFPPPGRGIKRKSRHCH